jgi:hypothetical protein
MLNRFSTSLVVLGMCVLLMHAAIAGEHCSAVYEAVLVDTAMHKEA